jgi:phage repressor protein C with HTH and peptisase S24 domain
MFHAPPDKLDCSNLSSVIYPAFYRPRDRAIVGFMPPHPDIASIRENLRRIMKKQNVAPTTLSTSVGTSRTLVKDLLEKNDDVRLSTLTKLAGALDVDIDELLSRPRVPVAGYIGAGGVVIFEDIGETVEPDNSVPRPPGVSGKVIALVVRGSSMFPKYRDGDVIYIQREHDGLLPDYIGEDCAVRLVTGETYIKQLARGSTEDRWTLRSLNAEDIEDVEIEWATPVLFIMPVRTRKMLDQ